MANPFTSMFSCLSNSTLLSLYFSHIKISSTSILVRLHQIMTPNCDLCLSLTPSQNIKADSSKRTREQITFLYDKQKFVFDVSEFQARAIIWFASREQGKINSNLSSISLQSLPYIVPGFSIKKSLQNFLLRRKERAQEASPYVRTVQ